MTTIAIPRFYSDNIYRAPVESPLYALMTDLSYTFGQFFCHNKSDIVFYDFLEHVCDRSVTVVIFTSMVDVGTTSVLHRSEGKINLKRYSRDLKNVPHLNSRLSNLDGFSVHLQPLINCGLKLARSGIFLYSNPKATKQDFKIRNPS